MGIRGQRTISNHSLADSRRDLSISFVFRLIRWPQSCLLAVPGVRGCVICVCVSFLSYLGLFSFGGTSRFMWYMEQVSKLGQPFAKFHQNFWIQSSQGKLFVDRCASEFEPRHGHLYKGKIPLFAKVKLTTEANIMKIFIREYTNELDMISRRNVEALRGLHRGTFQRLSRLMFRSP